MALTKVEYVDDVTVIHAENLNDIQDAIIALQSNSIKKPQSPSIGDFLCYTADGWGAVTVRAASGVSF